MNDIHTQHGGWDFSAALSLINAGHSDHELITGDNASLSPPSLTHSDSSEREIELTDTTCPTLGNFDKIWQYLGTSAPSSTFADSSAAEQRSLRSLRDSKEPKSVKWRDERLESIVFAAPPISVEALSSSTLNKQQRKKERRRLRKLEKGLEYSSAEDQDDNAKDNSAKESLPPRQAQPVSDGETDNNDSKIAFKRSKERQNIIQAIVAGSVSNTRKSGPATAHELFLHQVATKQSDATFGQPRYNLRSSQVSVGTLSAASKPSSSLHTLFTKKNDLLDLLYARFQTDWHTLAGLNYSHEPPHLPGRNVDSSGIHVFVDISNILIGFHDALKIKLGLGRHARLPRQKLSFFNLSMILERGRPAAKRCLAGSDMLECIEEAREIGYETNILERVTKEKVLTPRQRYFKARDRADKSGASSGGEGTSGPGSGTEDEFKTVTKRVEQAVDEILHLNMMLSIVDTAVPSTIVLATGDAAEAEYSQGFLSMCERALSKGWKVEVVAFKHNMSFAYKRKDWQGQWNGRFSVIELDDFVESLRL